ncbi:hypothetical protein HON86_02155 [Candidatus Woesearchaeota archaeon]|jgi:hypothetical protein|nr:hypothetical protein [Candidatus Woesearchaeota archaeon]MBT4835402.1 hypothetical protein [Candidatus Woesearchaeota archaeon]MBT6735266.1 hypothetical protein [Candidatus Woesearchaeota archaeon]MBT7170122.1 hypothetical protein [Candidatus Woesearchaeota archaeon]MBT7474512.1 hypothetical protein [Candidatus Woesearchaeota archaeon]
MDEIFFIDAEYKLDRESVFRKLNIMLDEEERAKTKFMKSYVFKLIRASKK